MRFSLSTLFLAVTLMGLACAGISLRTPGWAYAIVSLSLALYTIGNSKRISPAVPAGAFLIIGHSIFSWLFALLASWAAAAIYARRTPTSEPPS